MPDLQKMIEDVRRLNQTETSLNDDEHYAAIRPIANALADAVVVLAKGMLEWKCPSCQGTGESPDMYDPKGTECFGCQGTCIHPTAVATLAKAGLTVEQARELTKEAT